MDIAKISPFFNKTVIWLAKIQKIHYWHSSYTNSWYTDPHFGYVCSSDYPTTATWSLGREKSKANLNESLLLSFFLSCPPPLQSLQLFSLPCHSKCYHYSEDTEITPKKTKQKTLSFPRHLILRLLHAFLKAVLLQIICNILTVE